MKTHDINGRFCKGHKINLGRKLTEEHKKKIRDGNKGLIKGPFTEEHKRKISIANTGKTGEKSSHWGGGKIEHTRGYFEILAREHPFAHVSGYVMEHRLVMEKYLKRYLKPEEVVHHIDGNRKNNDIKNLMLFKNDREHQKYHRKILI